LRKLLFFTLLHVSLNTTSYAQGPDSIVVCTYADYTDTYPGGLGDINKLLTAFSTNGLLKYKVTSTKTNIQNPFALNDSTFYTYDSLLNLVRVDVSRWQSGQWVYNKRTEYTYDTLGNNIVKKEYNWNAINSSWVLNSEYNYHYISGNILDSSWVTGGFASGHKWDSIANFHTFTSWYWNGSSFDPIQRETDWWNLSGSTTLFLKEMYISNSWVPKFKEEYHFDSLDRIISLLISDWDSLTNTWIPGYLRNYDYTISPDRKYTYGLYWNKLSNQFDSLFTAYIQFDSIGRPEYEYEYLHQNNTSSSSHYTYDTNGNLVRLTSINGPFSSTKTIEYDLWNNIIHSFSSSSQQSGNKYFEEFCYRFRGDTIIFQSPDTLEICSGGTVDLNGLLVFPSEVYNPAWSPSSGVSNDSILSPRFSPASSTDYELSLQHANGTIYTFPLSVIVRALPIPPPLDSIMPYPNCHPDTTYLFYTPAPGLYHTWFSNNPFFYSSNDTIFVTSAGPGSFYSIYVTDDLGCKAYGDTIRVSMNNPPSSQFATNPFSFCLGDTIQLKIIAYDSTNHYQWYINGVDTNLSDPDFLTVTQDANYALTAVNPLTQCESSFSRTIEFKSVFPAPVISLLSDPVICANNADTAWFRSNYNHPDWSYYWLTNSNQFGQSNTDTFFTRNGSYVLLQVSNSSCRLLSDTIFYYTNNFIARITPAFPAPVCEPDSIVLSSTLADQYFWSNGETTQHVSVTSSGSYSVYAIDSLGCYYNSQPVVVLIHPSGPPPVISYQSPFLVSSIPGPVQWYRNDSLIVGATDELYEPTSGGLYSLSYSDSNGCTVISSYFPYMISGTGTVTTDVENSFSMYPNPFSEKTTIENSGPAKFLNCDIFNSQLMLIQSNQSFGSKIAIDGSMLTPGIYFFRLQIRDGHENPYSWIKGIVK
jgi:hypothetical protein